MVTLKDLRDRIQNLEKEKSRLLEEIKKLRKEAEEKAAALECEVAVLREEADSLKKCLIASSCEDFSFVQFVNLTFLC